MRKLALQLFILERAEITQRRVATDTIVEDLNVLKNCTTSLIMRWKWQPLGTLALECPKKAFHDRIIVTVSTPARADAGSGLKPGVFDTAS
jgi:hypothetical protein